MHEETNNTRLPLNKVEDGLVSKNTVFDYARMAARAEQKIIEMLDRSLQKDLAEAPIYADLPQSAQPRQGETLRGG